MNNPVGQNTYSVVPDVLRLLMLIKGSGSVEPSLYSYSEWCKMVVDECCENKL